MTGASFLPHRFHLRLLAVALITLAALFAPGAQPPVQAQQALTAASLDTSFSSDGKVTTDFGSTDEAYAVALQTDGKIVAAGKRGGDFAVARYNADGSLDTSFSSDGKVTTDFGTTFEAARGVAVQSDGKIVAAGYTGSGSATDFAVARYNADGSLDTSFSSDGKVTTAIGSASDIAWAMALQSDGKILVAGSSNNGTNNDFALVRYNANGTLDTSFSGDGKVTTAIGSGASSAAGMALQSDGKIVLAGYVGFRDDFALARYNTDGSLDTSFSSDGKVITDGGGTLDAANAVTVQSDGKIVAAGHINSLTTLGMIRYTSAGALDTSFGTGGKLTASGTLAANAVAMHRGDGIVVASSSNNDFALLRYYLDGTLDTTFGSNGKVTTDINSSADAAYSIAVHPDTAKIVAVGEAADDFALARYLGVHPPSENADLSALSVSSSDSATGTFSAVTLSPAFDKTVTSYTATVANDQTHVKITPTTEDPNAAVQVQNLLVDRGTASQAIALSEGTNDITVLVSAEATGVTKSYSLVITREAAAPPAGTPTVSLSAAPTTVNEGSSVTITATLSEALGANVTIPLTFSGADTSAHGILSNIAITAGSTTGSGTIPTTQDADAVHESFIVSLGTLPSTVALGSPASVTITINDDEAATPAPGVTTVSLSAAPTTVNEGSSVTVTATLSAALGADVTIPLTITSSDTSAHGTLAGIAITAGSTSGSGTITTTQDADAVHETFTVSLGTLPSSVGAGSPSSVTITINDDEATTSALPPYASEVVWESALTVRDYGWDEEPTGSPLGCSSAYTDARSCATSFSGGSTFTYAGTTYEIIRVLRRGGGEPSYRRRQGSAL